MNRSKCQFGLSEIEYLGFNVGPDSVRPSTEKTKAIRNLKRPTNVAELGTFLGLVGHYQKFVDRFAERACPLYELKKKGTKFV